MPKSEVCYAGLDVHKDLIAIAVAEQGRSVARDVGKLRLTGRSFRLTGST